MLSSSNIASRQRSSSLQDLGSLTHWSRPPCSMTCWGFSMHPVKEIEKTNTTDVVIDICQFDDTLLVSSFLFFLISNALSKGAPRFPRLSINFALFWCFGNGEPTHWSLRTLPGLCFQKPPFNACITLLPHHTKVSNYWESKLFNKRLSQAKHFTHNITATRSLSDTALAEQENLR